MAYQYNELKEKITAHAGKECADFAATLITATAGDVLASWYLTQFTTPATLAALQELPAGEFIPEEIKNKMQTKRAREAAREAKKRFDRVHEVEEIEAPAALSIVVEWHKSKTWGMNPRARVATERVATYGSASGCGYDKESAAIAGAFNANPEILKIIYDHAEAGGVFPYGVSTFAGLPSFDGGCGVSCFYSIFEACGYTFRRVASGKAFNVYEITKLTVQPVAAGIKRV